MKRTAKWQKHLTIKELKHLHESGCTSLKQTKINFAHQWELRIKNNHNPVVEPCWDCKAIERKLVDAGVCDKPGMSMTPTELRNLLAHHGVSQRKLAHLLDLDFRHINKMCAGVTPIRRHHELAIKHVLECDDGTA